MIVFESFWCFNHTISNYPEKNHLNPNDQSFHRLASANSIRYSNPLLLFHFFLQNLFNSSTYVKGLSFLVLLLCAVTLKPKGKMERIENKSALRIAVVISIATLFTSCAILLLHGNHLFNQISLERQP
jgi:hypothetical protein